MIYSFDVSKDAFKHKEPHHATPQATVTNYCVVKSSFAVCYLLEEDDNIYFYNYMQHKLIAKIKLFNYKLYLLQNTLIVNSLLLEQDGILFIILQFSITKDEDSDPILKTILYVIQFNLSSSTHNEPVNPLFYQQLGSIVV